MTGTPDGGFTLDFIGRTLLEMQREQRLMREDLNEFKADSNARYRDIESALFRADARWNELRSEVRGLRTACEQILHLLRAEQSH